jgi:DNA topoisomerase-2
MDKTTKMLEINKDLAKVFNQSDIKEHARKKTMWGGSFDPSNHEDYVLKTPESTMFSLQTVRYADSLYKNFDEVLVNVVDIWVKSKDLAEKYRVTKCIIEFPRNGYISIYNNGQGIPVDVVADLHGKPVYIPQLISTEFLAGSNNDDDEERITGGVNGIGLSMVNNNSEHFILETVDLKSKKHYIQECHDRLKTVDPPKITTLKNLSSLNNHKKGGTTMKFLPAYKIYKFDLNDDKDYNDLNCIFKARAVQIAAHTGIEVVYNGETLLASAGRKPVVETFAEMFMVSDQFVYTKVKHTKYDWDVVIGLTEGVGFESLSVINGVYVKTGNHINYMRDLVINAVRVRVERLLKKYREYKKSMVQNNLFVIISGNIPNPSFDSQTKTNISGSISKYKDYTLGKSIITKIWAMLEPRLVEQYLTDFKKNNTRKSNTNGIKKYKKAKYASTNKSEQCTLLICEGDSAESMTRTSLTSKKVPMSYDYYGTFNIQGVPMNSRTKSTAYESKDGKTVVRRQKQLVDNERLSSMEKVCNLNHSLTYETKEERDTLSYGIVVACVDQDLDGVGQIFGLLLSHFERFWPELILHGYVKQLATPIIRAFPKSGKDAVESFYTNEEYRHWVLNKFGKDERSTDGLDKWEVKYYKGLATHNDDEAIHMFQNYDSSLYTITYDDLASKTFEIYYGKDPDLRKIELVIRRPPVVINDMSLSCTEHLQSHTKEFQLDNIMRKLPHMYDGLNPARRKILCGSRNRFLSNNGEVKVFQLAGYIAEKMNYHHGSASLEKTIINMAQDYVGANNLPLLLPLSQFGSRFRSGNDYGAPRYIKTKLNKDLVSALFRTEDDYVLDYTYDEGVCNEPVCYVPVAPFALLESLEIPATGWKYAGYARDWKSVHTNILGLIKGYDSETKLQSFTTITMPFWKNKWNGTTRSVNSKTGKQTWSMGSYMYDDEKNVIEIFELPFQEGNESYVEKMESKTYILSVQDDSSKLQIDIKIKLKPNGFDDIVKTCENIGNPEFDVIEDYCLLKKSMGKHLNVIKDGLVHEAKSYNEILMLWFVKRHETYVRRFERLRVIIRLRIMFHKQVSVFVENHKKYNFSELDEDTATSLLTKDKYLKFNKALLDNPQFTPLEKMEFLVCDAKAANTSYNYLFAVGPRQRMETARISRAKKLKELEKYYKNIMSDDIVNTTWLEELKELDDVIIKGTTSEKGWLYNERKVNFK